MENVFRPTSTAGLAYGRRTIAWCVDGHLRLVIPECFCRESILLFEKRIGAVLQLAEAVSYADIRFLYLPVEDGVLLPEHLLRQGLDFCLSEKRQGKKVLIACGAGISRSAVFAIAGLKEAEGLSLLDAVRAVGKHHPESLPHPALWESLCGYYGKEVSLQAMLNALRTSGGVQNWG